MNRLLSITLIAVLFVMWGLTSAHAQRTCASNDHLLQQLADHPEMAIARQNLENFTQQFIQNQNNSANKTTNAIYNIPVVVHVLYHTATENISTAQIQSQIDVLNQDYQKLNADWTSTPAAFTSLVADCQIQFCLAQRDPQGNATTGIIRKSTTNTSFSADNDNAKHNSTNGDDAWPATDYLNLWVVPQITSGGQPGILGYAQFPGGPAATDGVVIGYNFFGNTGTLDPTYNKGRTATHEVGHWLNLYHVWGDDGNACTGSDLVGDTPNQGSENYGCPSYPHVSCSNGPNGDLFMNYMDYTDDACMFMFTNGQKSRMHALFAPGGSRNSITASQGCVPPASVCSAPAGLNATAVTSTSATLNWGAVSGATDYNLQWKPTSSSTWTTVSNIAATSYALSGLTAATSYDFKVSTNCSATSSSAYSAPVSFTSSSSAPCTTPGGLNVSGVNSTGAMLGWTAVPGAAGYSLQWRQGTGTWTTVAATAISGNSYTLTGLVASTSYSFRVRTKCGTTYTAYSAAHPFTTSGSSSCGTPNANAATNITPTTATANWTAVSGVTNYTFQYKATTSGAWTTVSNVSTNSYDLTGLTGATSYDYRVQANCSGALSGYSPVVSFTTATAPCNVPTGLGVSNLTPTSVTLNWTNVPGVTGYSLQWRQGSSSWITVAATAISGSSYQLAGLTPSTSYTFRVRTKCGTTYTAYSAAYPFTTTAATCNTPAPAAASAITSTTASANWAAVSGASSYNLQWKTTAGSTWNTISNIAGTSTSLTSLTASTSYDYKVQTNCTGGAMSVYSSVISFTTTSGGCTDNFESNDTKATAKYIPANTNQSGKIGASGDLDWFKFVNTASSPNISVTLTTLPFDYDIYVYHGSTLLGTGYNAGTTSEQVSYNTSVVDTYYVRVEGYNGANSSTLCYTLNAHTSSTSFREMAPAINSKGGKEGMTIYPNPATNEATLRYVSDKEQDATISVIDQAGRLAYTKAVHLDPGVNAYGMDISTLPAGFYYVRLITGDGNITAKLVIQK